MNCSECKHLKVLKSAAGFYLGTEYKNLPYCRASKYYATKAEADEALRDGFELRNCMEINAVMNGLLPCEVNS